MKRLSSLALVLSAFAIACGGSSSSSEPATSGGGEEHGEGHGHHHGSGVPELDALHDELGPVWHGADHSAACAHADSFHTHAAAIRAAAAPAGADAAAWASAGDTLVSSSDALSAECTASGPEVEARLSAFHDAFHAALDLAGGEHHDHDGESDEHADEDHASDEAAAHARGEHHDHDGESDEHAHH